MSASTQWQPADEYGEPDAARNASKESPTSALCQTLVTPVDTNLTHAQWTAVSSRTAAHTHEATGFGGINWGDAANSTNSAPVWRAIIRMHHGHYDPPEPRATPAHVIIANPAAPDALTTAQAASRRLARRPWRERTIASIMGTTQTKTLLALTAATSAISLSSNQWAPDNIHDVIQPTATASTIAAALAIYTPAAWRTLRNRQTANRGQLDNQYVTITTHATTKHGLDWLRLTQEIAHHCAHNDKVADLCGPMLRNILWAARHDLDNHQVTNILHDLAEQTRAYAHEQQALEATLTADLNTQHLDQQDRQARLDALTEHAQDLIQQVRLDTSITREVRHEWHTRLNNP